MNILEMLEVCWMLQHHVLVRVGFYVDYFNVFINFKLKARH